MYLVFFCAPRSLFGATMDALTQLEQACAVGCVRISESFAAALRPNDPRWQAGWTNESAVPTISRLGVRRRSSPLSDTVVHAAARVGDSADKRAGLTRRLSLQDTLSVVDPRFDFTSAPDLTLAGVAPTPFEFETA